MDKNIGTKNIDIIYFLNSFSLKTDFLYFDKLYYCESQLEQSLLVGESLSKGLDKTGNLFKKNIQEIEFLQKSGMLEPFKPIILETPEECFGLHSQENFRKLINTITDLDNERVYQLKNLTKSTDFLNSLENILLSSSKSADLNSIISSFVLNYKNQNCTPIICKNANLNQNADTQAIINLIIKKFPFIDDTVGWEKIIEFKADTDAKNKLNALKNWLTDISKNNYTVTEVEQKLDYFIDEYESLLKLHKLKVKYKKFDLILTATVGTIENLIKLNFTDIGKNLLTLKEEEINLKIEEKNLKGQEIAYISNIITHFDNDKSKLVKNCL
jgi:hypothetical protein